MWLSSLAVFPPTVGFDQTRICKNCLWLLTSIATYILYIYNLACFTLTAPQRHRRPVNRKNKQMKSNNTLPEFLSLSRSSVIERRNGREPQWRANFLEETAMKSCRSELFLLFYFFFFHSFFLSLCFGQTGNSTGGEKKSSFGGSRLPSWARSVGDNSKHGKCARRN